METVWLIVKGCSCVRDMYGDSAALLCLKSNQRLIQGGKEIKSEGFQTQAIRVTQAQGYQ